MTHKPNGPEAAAPVVNPEMPASGPDGAVDPYGAGGLAEDVAAQLAKAEAEASEFRDAWLRAKAETENVRKQSQADVAKAHKYAVERFAEDLLPVKDALEQTLAAGDVSLETIKAGAALTLKALQSSFDRAQVIELNPVGEKYDPHRHQAMQLVEADQPPNTVVDVFQKGYLINDRVLRPALVTVAKSHSETA
jgi:molecular chaperone GrpE